MSKKVISGLAVSVLFSLLIFCYGAPVFNGYSDKYTVYSLSSSSGKEEKVSASDFPLIKKGGESFEINSGEISVGEILSRYNAKLIFTERIAEGIGYYAYSERIPYAKTVKNKKINLHIFVGKEKTVVGSPIIFGSF